ncbi:MAG: hypothetical protein RJB34_1603 [Pseudomonadota bacterium]
MRSPVDLLRESQTRLNAALADYDAPQTSEAAREFHSLRLQSAIFNFDITYDIVSNWSNEPTGFAGKVALKSLVLRLYEYESLSRNDFLPRLLTLANQRCVEVDMAKIRDLQKQWSPQLKAIRSWSKLRNKAAGHYDRQMKSQLEQLQLIDRGAVMEAAQGFLAYNIQLLRILQSIGRGNGNTAA